MTIRRKIALLFTILAAAVIFISCVSVYIFAKQFANQDFFERLKTRTRIAAQTNFEENELSVAIYNEIREKHFQKLANEKEYILPYPLTDSSLKVLSPDIPRNYVTRLYANGEISFRQKDVFYAGLRYNDNGNEYLIFVSAKNEQGAKEIAFLQRLLLFSFISSVVIIFVAGLVFSREVINPIARIIRDVKRISVSNLHMRLKSRSGKDEIAELTQTFNDMLDRLETAFESQSNFVNNASHELRTPLTTIMGEAELALQQERTQIEYTRSFKVIMTEAERLDRITANLLDLAQSGFDGEKTPTESVRVDELILAVREIVLYSAIENAIEVDFSKLPEQETALTIEGNHTLLKLAITNILHNACKYSGDKPVVIGLRIEENNPVIFIRDQGIGIPEKELAFIFDPFFRASNTERFRGFGVGLPLSMKIIRLHRGEISYSSKVNEGTEVEVRFPARN